MRIRSSIRTIALAASAAIAVSAAVGCGGTERKGWAKESRRGGKHGGKHGRGGDGPGGGDEAKALIVETTQLSSAKIERRYRTSGTLQALQSAELVAIQAGIIRDITVEEGDTVEPGQILVRLDGRELKLEASRADLQVSNLEHELRRLERAAASNAISREELDKQRHAVNEARASAQLSKHAAKQSVVRAPFNGTITKRHVDIGNLATTATPLLSLADTSAIEVELHLPEKESGHVKLNSSVEIELLDGATFPARVIRRAPVVDAMTGTVKFTVQAAEFPAAAVPGAFARARVLVDARESAPSLPASAVFWVEGRPQVYVVREGKARRTEVELGLEGETRIEITSGISPDDEVIADSSAGITEGMPVKTQSGGGGGGSAGAEQRSGS